MRAKQKIVNLYKDGSIYNIKQVVSISDEEDLDRFWHHLDIHNFHKNHYFTTLFYNFALKYLESVDSDFFEIILEENDDSLYFTLWNQTIALLFKNHIENQELDFLYKTKRISLKLNKFTCDILNFKEIEDIKELQANKETKDSYTMTQNDINNIRSTTQENKISALELAELLDDTIADKIEDLQEAINNIIEVLYKLNKNNHSSMKNQLTSIAQIFVQVESIIETIGFFNIVAESCNTLNDFLNTLDTNILLDEKKHLLFTSSFMSLTQDLEEWIQMLFIKQETKNAHYFNSSFSNNCIEIINMMHEREIESDEDDLEFF